MRLNGVVFSFLLACCLVGAAEGASAERIRAFVPGKPLEFTVELKDFVPWDVLQPKTVLGGDASGGLTITVIVEKEKAPMTPEQAVAKYWLQGKPGEHVTEFASPHLIVVSPKGTPRSFNGYATKDNYSFDIHVSADPSKVTKQQVVDTIRSFEIAESPENKAIDDLIDKLNAAKQAEEEQKLLLAFTEKYPKNSWGAACLGEVCFRMEQNDKAEKACLRALEIHKTQPLCDPTVLWRCYDTLGMVYGMAKRYDAAKPYFEKGYACAEAMSDDELAAASAYNCACLYAETGDAKAALKYLGNAIKLVPKKRDEARKDSSFEGIRNQPEFQKLVSR